MIAALQRLSQSEPSELQGEMMAFGINKGKTMSELFVAHITSMLWSLMPYLYSKKLEMIHFLQIVLQGQQEITL